MGNPFGTLLQDARRDAGLSQDQLAARAGVSAQAVGSWETGRRAPRRDRVIDLADALGLDTRALNRWLAVLALDPVPDARVIPLVERRRELAALAAECRSYEWPCLVMDWNFEVIGWNHAANTLSELDFGADLAEPGARQLLRMALSKHYQDRLLNWDEAIGVMIAMWKSEQQSITDPGSGALFFSRMMEYVFAHHAGQVERLMRLWQAPAANRQGIRGVLPIRWRAASGDVLNLYAIQTPWSDFDGSWALDWMPADGTTWEWFERQRAARPPAPPDQPAPNGDDLAGRSSWRRLLRESRRAVRLSRRQLAERSGIAEETIYAYESGRRAPTRESLLDLCGALELEGPRMNAILDAAGMEPEPSDWARILLGEDVRFAPRRLAAMVRDHAHTPAEVHEHIDAHPWPCLIVNGTCDVAVANPAARKLLGMDLEAVPRGPERNLVSLVTSAPFRERIENWAEVAARVVPRALIPYVTGTAGARDGYFDAVVHHVRERDGHTRNLAALFDAWRTNRQVSWSARLAFDVRWHAPGASLAFHAVIAPWNPFDPYWAIDLHPADAATWAWFA